MIDTQRYVGLISGTSMDAVDACVVEFDGSRPTLLATHGEPVPGPLRDRLLRLIGAGGEGVLHELGQLDVEVGTLFAAACNNLLTSAGIDASDINAIGSHGQTVRHGIDAQPPYTMQIGDPNVIAQMSGVDVVADFRRRDVALGGQGAPLAPAFHAATLTDAGETRIVLNLGGIANVTLLPPQGEVRGWDTGPANCLMDAWTRQHRNEPYDASGRWAGEGDVIDPLLESMLSDDYFKRDAPKSTGTETFHLDWLRQHPIEDYAAVDVQSTLCALTATTVVNAIATLKSRPDRVLLCGGGRHNATLVSQLTDTLAGIAVEPTDGHGVPGDWVEAMTFAWLANQYRRGLPGNLPSVTGATQAAILGGLYPAS